MKIEAKSDQLNSDDLLAGPRTITITAVRGVDGDQPVAVSFEGDGGKPFKPCKTVRRVMVHCWGDEAKQYVGRRMTLYRDPEVAFGGMKVGGIRVSHMSHIDRPMVIPLLVTRGKKAPYKVEPLRAEVRSARQRPEPPAQDHDRSTDNGGQSDDFPGDRGRSFGAGGQAPAEGFTGWAAEAAADIDQKTSVADLDAYSDDPDVFESFQQLAASDPAQAKKLEAKLRGRRKVLLDRERG